MKLVLCSSSGAKISCVDWPTALVGLMCRGRHWWVDRKDAPSDKAAVATLLLFSAVDTPQLMVSRACPEPRSYLTLDEIDRLMAGEDL
jgi:hypothetical protein